MSSALLTSNWDRRRAVLTIPQALDIYWRELYKENYATILLEVIIMIDLSNKTIQDIFYQQIRKLSISDKLDSFDRQFSEGLVK